MSEEKLDRIEAKLDKVAEDSTHIKVTLAEQHISLKDHIRRTELLEEAVEPIKKHVAMVQGVLKLIGLIGIVTSVTEVIINVIQYIGKH